MNGSARKPKPSSSPPPPPHAPYPTAEAILRRLREVLGAEETAAPDKVRWHIPGEREGMDVNITMDPRPCTPTEHHGCAEGEGAADAGEPCVIWVTRPGEAKPERCPIVTMEHLDSFLALVSIARRSAAPVHKHVCPGDS